MQAEHLQQRFIHTSKKPLSLSHTPNYDQALAIDVIAADQITEAEFREKYVDRNRPCLLTGAIKHWPAYSRWSNTQYLKEKTSNVVFTSRNYPKSEFKPYLKKILRNKVTTLDESHYQQISFHDFLEKVANESEPCVISTMGIAPNRPLGELSEDIKGFTFLPDAVSSRWYPPCRAYLYRQSYTDWHFHPTDETLLAQVVGAKEVLLIPPNEDSSDILWNIVATKGYLFDIDSREFPEFLNIKPYKVVIEPSDALYIPAYWWHVVESVEDKFGASVAVTFKTPDHLFSDLSYPAVRELLKHALTSSSILFSMLGWLHLKILGHFLMRSLFFK
jgi:hypothetical protein